MPLDSAIPFIASPNFSSRDGRSVVGTVVHYTAGGRASGSIRWLCMPEARASAHFVISRDGRTTQLVELDMKAWHAGVSEMQVGQEILSDAGRFTVGVELANCGLLHKVGEDFFYEVGRDLKKYAGPEPQRAELKYDDGHSVEGWWEPYPDAQMDALQDLLRKMTARGYGTAASNLIGHEEVAMPLGRKTDPGALFDWNRFGRKSCRRTSAGLL